MGINAATIFEWRPDTGSDDNGGGFADLDPGTSVDYSQQAAAEFTETDGATAGIGNTTFTSANGGFTAPMVGNTLNLTAGTNAVTGVPFQITAYTNTNTVTLDRAPDDGVGGVSGATFYVGGARAIYDGTFHEALTAGNIHYIQKGTMTLGSAIDVALDGTFGAPFKHIGYNVTRGDNPTGSDRPTIVCGANTFSFDNHYWFENIRLTTTAAEGWRCDQISFRRNCRAQNTSTTSGRAAFRSGGDNRFLDCEAQSLVGNGFHVTLVDNVLFNCFAHDCNNGFFCATNQGDTQFIACIASMCYGTGIKADGTSPSALGNTVYNSLIGLFHAGPNHQGALALNNILDSCVTAGQGVSGHDASDYNDFNNYHGNDTDEGSDYTKGPNATAADPEFVGETVWTDLASTTATNILTSVSGGFNEHFAQHSWIRIESGTNFTAGWYRVTSLDSDTQVTLATDPTNGSNASSGTMRACNDFRTGANVQGTGTGMLQATGGVGADSTEPQGAWAQAAGGGAAGMLAGSDMTGGFE